MTITQTARNKKWFELFHKNWKEKMSMKKIRGKTVRQKIF